MDRKIRSAAALKYSLDSPGLPKVVASGKGEIAERIIQIAKENGIPIEENEGLSDLLASVEIGNDIPSEAIIVIAEILAQIFRLNRNMSGTKG